MKRCISGLRGGLATGWPTQLWTRLGPKAPAARKPSRKESVSWADEIKPATWCKGLMNLSGQRAPLFLFHSPADGGGGGQGGKARATSSGNSLPFGSAGAAAGSCRVLLRNGVSYSGMRPGFPWRICDRAADAIAALRPHSNGKHYCFAPRNGQQRRAGERFRKSRAAAPRNRLATDGSGTLSA